MVRRLLVAVAVLMVLITASSAYIRLQQVGLSCSDWPHCYAQTMPSREVIPQGGPLLWARALHRLAATIVGVLVAAAIVLGWSRFPGAGARTAAILLGALTLGLAWLGVYTPSTMPIVTVANVAGGMAMVAIALWLANRMGQTQSRHDRFWQVLLALLAVQVVLGAALAGSYSALACEGLMGCSSASLAGAFEGIASLIQPVMLPLEPAAVQSALRKTLHMLHRYGAVVVAAVVIAYALRHVRSTIVASLLLILLVVDAGLGIVMVTRPLSLDAAVLHNAMAGILVGAVAMFPGRASRMPSPS